MVSFPHHPTTINKKLYHTLVVINLSHARKIVIFIIHIVNPPNGSNYQQPLNIKSNGNVKEKTNAINKNKDTTKQQQKYNNI